MNFDFSPEQKQFRDQLRRMLVERCPPSEVRTVLDGKAEYSQSTWQALAEIGALGVTVPEIYGGVGLGHLELCVVAEEIGRALAPVPALSTLYLACEALVHAGSDEQKRTHLGAIAAGRRVFCVDPSVSTGSPGVDGSLSLDRNRITGVLPVVADGGIADYALLAAKADKSSAGVLVIVRLDVSGVRRWPVNTLDPTRNHAALEFDDVEAEHLAADAGLLAWLQMRAAVMLAFEQLGGAEASLERARDHALQRIAFGRPIGSYQALKHKLADVYAQNVIARAHAYHAAWALSSDAPDLPLAAASARVAAGEAFSLAAQENIQVHGGIGFTWAADCHLFYRRARLLSKALGGPLTWKKRVFEGLEQQAQPQAGAKSKQRM